MACATATLSFGFRFLRRPCSTRASRTCSIRIPLLNKFNSLKLSSSSSTSGSILPQGLCTTVSPHPQRLQPLTIVSAKGYKMKTHKASAKRFRVTGRGKIVRRRAGKQHLLAKKNTKRKLRLSKMDLGESFNTKSKIHSSVYLHRLSCKTSVIMDLSLLLNISSVYDFHFRAMVLLIFHQGPSSYQECPSLFVAMRLCDLSFIYQHAVSRSDYDNVIGALPYLKVNRRAT